MKLLTKDQLISMHQALIDETGGVSGLRDDGLLVRFTRSISRV